MSQLDSKLIVDYYAELDAAIEKLSLREEGRVSKLPPWVLTPRHITVCVTPDGKGVALRVTPDNSLVSDEITWIADATFDQIKNILHPWSFYGAKILGRTPFALIAGVQLVEANNPFAPPAFDDPSVIGFGQSEGYLSSFAVERAREDAVGLWNAVLITDGKPGNFIVQTKQIFDKFLAITKRKQFLERRIHRYLNEHSRILLPSHKRCFFEHEIFLGTERRVIDFVLEREAGMPAILIELESPSHKILRKNGEPTAEANHATNQIAEWISFIDKDAATNASGDFSFLAGPKQRLVIIGKKIYQKRRLLDSKFTDTTLWTYEILLEEARMRWNEELANQYELVGLSPIKPF